MKGLQCFCICENDAQQAYSTKSKLSLSLDKDDFVVNGYAVDAQKHPIKPSAKGKERVAEEDEVDDSDEEDEVGDDDKEFEDIGAHDVPSFHEEMRDDPSWVPSVEHFAVASGFMSMRPCNLFAEGAGPSSSQQQPPESADVHTISDSNETSDDQEEHLLHRGARSPPSKRQRTNVVHPSPAESTSPPSSVDYARQVQLLEKRLAEQERKFLDEMAAQQQFLADQESQRQAHEAEKERQRKAAETEKELRSSQRAEALLEKQRIMMEQSQQQLITRMLAQIGFVVPPALPAVVAPEATVSVIAPALVVPTAELAEAPAESPSRSQMEVVDSAVDASGEHSASPSTPTAPVIDLDAESPRAMVIIPRVSQHAPFSSLKLAPAVLPVEVQPTVVGIPEDPTPSYSSGGSLTGE